MRLDLTLTFLVFLVLKLTGVIDWSWWWVTAPIWLAPVLFVVFFAAYLFLAILQAVIRRK
jgi:hypothetical protein